MKFSPQSAGFHSPGDIQSADSLSPPVLWSNVPATVSTNFGICTVVLPATNQQRYFRLFQQP